MTVRCTEYYLKKNFAKIQKRTANKKLLSVREQKRLEWWSVRSKEGNLKLEDNGAMKLCICSDKLISA